MASLLDYNEEVIEALCELGGVSEAEAQSLAASKRSEIEYAHKYRLSPSISGLTFRDKRLLHPKPKLKELSIVKFFLQRQNVQLITEVSSVYQQKRF